MSLYLPEWVQISRIDAAVSEYDERLRFARNDNTGDWCVWMKQPHGEAELPILGFQELLHPDDVLKRLHNSDTRRHGEEILDRMNRQNAAIKKELDYKADQASAEAAEHMEWFNRKLDKTDYKKVYFGR